jgi:hypothetical protein
MRVILAAIFVAGGPVAAQDLVSYDCDLGTQVEVIELPRDTLVLWWDDDSAVALSALPTAGYGRLWQGETVSWRAFDDGTAELATVPPDPGQSPTVERCALSAS